MGTKGFESAQSLERYLNRGVIFVQGLDPTATKNEVIQVLSQVCKQPQQGRIDILQAPDGRLRGTAFINFHNREDAKPALEKWRFGLELHGRKLKMQYSSDREFKDVIQGPHAARFKVLVRNLPEDFDAEAIFEKFSKYGEILQVHSSADHQGGNFAIIQYVDVAAVPAAIKGSHRERVQNHVITVEPYRPNATFGTVPRAVSNYPSANGVSASSARPGGAGGSGVGLQGMTFAALQQQQELEQERERLQQQGNDYAGFGAGVAFGDFGSENGVADAAEASMYDNGAVASSVGGGPASTSPDRATGNMAPIPSFYATPAAGTVAAATAVGSLTSLLTAALDHVRLLDEQLCCPITQEPMVEPVVAADGNTYERIAIQAWLNNHDTSPLTNETLPSKSLVPNNLIRKIMEDLKGRANGGALPAASTASSSDATVGVAATNAVPAAAAPTSDRVSDMGVPAAAEPAAQTVAAEAPPVAEAEVATVVPVAANVVPAMTQYQYMPYTAVDPVTGQVQLYHAPQAQPYGVVRYHPVPVTQAEQQVQHHQPTPAHPAHLMAHMARQQQQQQQQQQQPFQYNVHAPAYFSGAYRPSGM